ncbi:hypothetical protein LshimejAT787_0206990 [Lyophyllum shimeji]|uniref:DUF6589 domain-containing protein n=1 Tax=Lyophyllum shimeji TaxID=47721 RepID=A0A9P3PGN1_LYOSH|nr:hypothetical protein LshimejAT787_0206990 [Lyophyllum shimeji]
MVNSLSTKSAIKIQELAQTLTGSFAYDNFDMEFKSHVPTVEKSGETMKHATSAIIFPLIQTQPDDLRCSNELWGTDPLNPELSEGQKRPHRGLESLIPPPKEATPSRYIRIIAWHFRHALLTFCEDFKDYQSKLEQPESVIQIPITTTKHVPCRAMDINQSTTDGQGDILKNLCEQGKIGDSIDTPGAVDISDYVQLVHGDLRTGELLEASKQSRSIERNPVRRLQFVIFVMGLFHYLMACGDAIWRMFLESKTARKGPNSFWNQICKIRPHDSGKITQKYNFRMMHEVIHQCGWARMLDCWRVELQKQDPSCTSVEAYAATKPSWDDIVAVSITLATNYLDKPNAEDMEFRNSSITLARLVQYIELAHAMKHGDIGRVEMTFLHWAYVFKSVRKHKYSAYLIKLMNDMKHVYPEQLKKAIRMNWLVNPTGRKDGFRGVDWVVELMNLYTKVTYSGASSNRTFQLVIKNSPLIQIFRSVHENIEDNFHLLHRSVRHAPPNLKNTLTTLTSELKKHQAHEIALRIGVQYRETEALTDHFRQGMLVLQTEKTPRFGSIDEEGEGGEEDETPADELDLDGIQDI